MDAGAAGNVSRRIQDADSQPSPPHKTRKMQPTSDSPRAEPSARSTTDNGHEDHDHGDQERPPRRSKDKKGDAKRQRKAKAAAEAENCQYYIDTKGGLSLKILHVRTTVLKRTLVKGGHFKNYLRESAVAL